MANPWKSDVKNAGKLLVFNGISAGKWSGVFAAALNSFNILSKRYALGVEVEAAKEKGDANVFMQVAESVASHTFGDTKKTETFNGNGFHGRTFGFVQDGAIQEAAIFLPSDPQHQAGFIGGKMTYERANADMMRVIAVHELIHASCLDDNKDHSKTDGVFVDRLTPVNGKLVSFWSGGAGKPMPPMFLDAVTVSSIKRFWS